MVAKIFHNQLQNTLSHQFFMKIFYVYARMHGESGEFFPEFFDLKVSIIWKEVLEVVSGQCVYCITLCIHILFYNFNKSSNLRAGSRKDAIHDAFDTIYVSCIHNSSRNF